MTPNEKLTEPGFMETFQLGGPSAFRTILKLYSKKWVHFANELLDDQLHAEEVVLETYAGLWHMKTHLSNWSSIRTYMTLTITSNCADHLKKELNILRGGTIEISKNIPGHKTLPRYFRYDTRTHYNYLKQIQPWILILPARYRKVFILSFIIEKDNTSIANILGIERRSVNKYRTDAIQRLFDASSIEIEKEQC